MSRTYYISQHGSNKHAGTSTGSAWASLDMLDKVKLQAGDRVLLERGSVFKSDLLLKNESGTQKAPILISAYGKGVDPVIQGVSQGVTALNADWVTLEHLTFRGTANAAIYGKESDHWVMNHISIENAGGAKTQNGSISWWKADGLSVKNSTVSNSHGDGFWGMNVKHVTLEKNSFKNVSGKDADNVQIEKGEDITIRGNQFSIGKTDSTKGNLVFKGDGLLMDGNQFSGGSYGTSLNGHHVTATNNHFSHHQTYDWSASILLSASRQSGNIHDVTINKNYFADTNRDIAIDGTKGASQFTHVRIESNHFQSWDYKAVAINNASFKNSLFSGNQFEQNIAQSVLKSYSATIGNAVNSSQNTSSGGEVLAINASSDSFHKAPVLSVYVDDVFLFAKTITASHSKGKEQTVWINTGDLKGHDTLTFAFENDEYGGRKGLDSNLYLHDMRLDKQLISTTPETLSTGVRMDKVTHDLIFYTNSEVSFDIDDLLHG